MRLLKLLSLALLLAVPAAAQVNDTYVIAAAANAPGAFGTRWSTQFSIFNPQTEYDLVVSVVYQPTGGGTGIEELVRVPANSVAYSDNILDDLFDVSGSGALFIATFPEDNPGVPDQTLARAFLVTSNTFNNSKSGTYGQTIPGVWAGLQDYDVDNISAIAHGIRNISSLGWRTNIGAVNLGRCTATMLVNVYDVNGKTILNRASFPIPPLGHMQDRLPVTVDRGSLEFFIDDPCANDANRAAVVFPYTSTIDELSGDPTYQTPTLLASAKTLFGKKGIDPMALGKRIDTATARLVRSNVERRGMAALVVDGNGYRIVK